MKPESNNPKTLLPKSKIPEDHKWSFSFQYWKQTKHFGIGDLSAGWFVDFFIILGKLNQELIKETFEDSSKKKFYNINTIDFDRKGVKLSINDFNHIPNKYKNDELNIFEFNITDESRAFGFFNEKAIFCICYLDPFHSGVPSKRNDYKQADTTIAKSEEENHDKELQNIKGICQMYEDSNVELDSMIKRIEKEYKECYFKKSSQNIKCPIDKILLKK